MGNNFFNENQFVAVPYKHKINYTVYNGCGGLCVRTYQAVDFQVLALEAIVVRLGRSSRSLLPLAARQFQLFLNEVPERRPAVLCAGSHHRATSNKLEAKVRSGQS